MTARQHSAATLVAGMDAVKYGTDASSRKRELEEIIKVAEKQVSCCIK